MGFFLAPDQTILVGREGHCYVLSAEIDDSEVNEIIEKLSPNGASGQKWTFNNCDFYTTHLDRLQGLLLTRAIHLELYETQGIGEDFYLRCLQSSNCLRELRLTPNDTVDLPLLMGALKRNNTLTAFTIGFRGQATGDQDYELFAQVIEANTALQTLKIYSNRFGDQGAIRIAEALDIARGRTDLRELTLLSCCIKDKGYMAFADVFRKDQSGFDHDGNPCFGLRLTKFRIDTSLTEATEKALGESLREVKRRNANIQEIFPPHKLCRLQPEIPFYLERNKYLDFLGHMVCDDNLTMACFAISQEWKPSYHTDHVFDLLRRIPYLFRRNNKL